MLRLAKSCSLRLHAKGSFRNRVNSFKLFSSLPPHQGASLKPSRKESPGVSKLTLKDYYDQAVRLSDVNAFTRSLNLHVSRHKDTDLTLEICYGIKHFLKSNQQLRIPVSHWVYDLSCLGFKNENAEHSALVLSLHRLMSSRDDLAIHSHDVVRCLKGLAIMGVNWKDLSLSEEFRQNLLRNVSAVAGSVDKLQLHSLVVSLGKMNVVWYDIPRDTQALLWSNATLHGRHFSLKQNVQLFEALGRMRFPLNGESTLSASQRVWLPEKVDNTLKLLVEQLLDENSSANAVRDIGWLFTNLSNMGCLLHQMPINLQQRALHAYHTIADNNFQDAKLVQIDDALSKMVDLTSFKFFSEVVPPAGKGGAATEAMTWSSSVAPTTVTTTATKAPSLPVETAPAPVTASRPAVVETPKVTPSPWVSTTGSAASSAVSSAASSAVPLSPPLPGKINSPVAQAVYTSPARLEALLTSAPNAQNGDEITAALTALSQTGLKFFFDKTTEEGRTVQSAVFAPLLTLVARLRPAQVLSVLQAAATMSVRWRWLDVRAREGLFFGALKKCRVLSLAQRVDALRCLAELPRRDRDKVSWNKDKALLQFAAFTDCLAGITEESKSNMAAATEMFVSITASLCSLTSDLEVAPTELRGELFGAFEAVRYSLSVEEMESVKESLSMSLNVDDFILNGAISPRINVTRPKPPKPARTLNVAERTAALELMKQAYAIITSRAASSSPIAPVVSTQPVVKPTQVPEMPPTPASNIMATVAPQQYAPAAATQQLVHVVPPPLLSPVGVEMMARSMTAVLGTEIKNPPVSPAIQVAQVLAAPQPIPDVDFRVYRSSSSSKNSGKNDKKVAVSNAASVVRNSKRSSILPDHAMATKATSAPSPAPAVLQVHEEVAAVFSGRSAAATASQQLAPAAAQPLVSVSSSLLTHKLPHVAFKEAMGAPSSPQAGSKQTPAVAPVVAAPVIATISVVPQPLPDVDFQGLSSSGSSRSLRNMKRNRRNQAKKAAFNASVLSESATAAAVASTLPRSNGSSAMTKVAAALATSPVKSSSRSGGGKTSKIAPAAGVVATGERSSPTGTSPLLAEDGAASARSSDVPPATAVSAGKSTRAATKSRREGSVSSIESAINAAVVKAGRTDKFLVVQLLKEFQQSDEQWDSSSSSSSSSISNRNSSSGGGDGSAGSAEISDAEKRKLAILAALRLHKNDFHRAALNSVAYSLGARGVPWSDLPAPFQTRLLASTVNVVNSGSAIGERVAYLRHFAAMGLPLQQLAPEQRDWAYDEIRCLAVNLAATQPFAAKDASWLLQAVDNFCVPLINYPPAAQKAVVSVYRAALHRINMKSGVLARVLNVNTFLRRGEVVAPSSATPSTTTSSSSSSGSSGGSDGKGSGERSNDSKVYSSQAPAAAAVATGAPDVDYAVPASTAKPKLRGKNVKTVLRKNVAKSPKISAVKGEVKKMSPPSPVTASAASVSVNAKQEASTATAAAAAKSVANAVAPEGVCATLLSGALTAAAPEENATAAQLDEKIDVLQLLLRKLRAQRDAKAAEERKEEATKRPPRVVWVDSRVLPARRPPTHTVFSDPLPVSKSGGVEVLTSGLAAARRIAEMRSRMRRSETYVVQKGLAGNSSGDKNDVNVWRKFLG